MRLYLSPIIAAYAVRSINKKPRFYAVFCIIFVEIVNNVGMKAKKVRTKALLPHTVSANEYTGSLQKISLDPDEVRRFHDEYVGGE